MQLSEQARLICKKSNYKCHFCYLKSVCLSNSYSSELDKTVAMNELASKYRKRVGCDYKFYNDISDITIQQSTKNKRSRAKSRAKSKAKATSVPLK